MCSGQMGQPRHERRLMDVQQADGAATAQNGTEGDPMGRAPRASCARWGKQQQLQYGRNMGRVRPSMEITRKWGKQRCNGTGQTGRKGKAGGVKRESKGAKRVEKKGAEVGRSRAGTSPWASKARMQTAHQPCKCHPTAAGLQRHASSTGSNQQTGQARMTAAGSQPHQQGRGEEQCKVGHVQTGDRGPKLGTRWPPRRA